MRIRAIRQSFYHVIAIAPSEDERLAKKKGKRPKKKDRKAEDDKEEAGPPAPGPRDEFGEGGWIRPTEKDEGPVTEEPLPEKKELAPWKRIGLALGVCIGINAAFLPIIFLPIMGVIIMLMLAPYLGAFVGARWLKREKKSEWIGAAAWFVVIWPSVLVLIMLALLRTFGSFDLEIELYASIILAMVYIFPTIFSLVGFHQGSRTAEERDELMEADLEPEEAPDKGPEEKEEE
jgi:hypothetical protein